MSTAVVVGAGFGGVVAARELVRKGWQVVLIDPGARPGRGLAYGTGEPWHLLNSPASAMSVDPDLPDDFLHWCRARDSRVRAGDFLPRMWYGEYLTEVLLRADDQVPGALTIHKGRVARIFGASHGASTVLLADDVVINADRVVLAVGNARPDERFAISDAARRSPAYVRDPWQTGALDRLPEGPVLLVGTGLTAIDVALTLANSGRYDLITAISRHGLLPRAHAVPVAGPYEQPAEVLPPMKARPTGSPGEQPAEVLPTRNASPALEQPAGELRPRAHGAPSGFVLPAAVTLSGLTRAIRAMAEQQDWRTVVDALRPHWNSLWARLNSADQQRFLRHLARYWEVHRHRMAPSIAASIDRLRAEGKFAVRAGEVCGITAEPDGSLRAVLRATTIHTGVYAAIVNCTGPGRLIEADPLVRSLIADGLAQPGPHGLGLDTDEHGALIGRSRRPSAIYTLGSPRRGRLWETTAAPEIRAQARALADHLIPRRSVSAGEGALGSCRADSAYPLPS